MKAKARQGALVHPWLELSQLRANVGQERAQMSDKMWRLKDVFCVFHLSALSTSLLRAVPGHLLFRILQCVTSGSSHGRMLSNRDWRVLLQVIVKSGDSPRVSLLMSSF